jgi:hypothetical protein
MTKEAEQINLELDRLEALSDATMTRLADWLVEVGKAEELGILEP